MIRGIHAARFQRDRRMSSIEPLRLWNFVQVRKLPAMLKHESVVSLSRLNVRIIPSKVVLLSVLNTASTPFSVWFFAAHALEAGRVVGFVAQRIPDVLLIRARA